MKNGKAIYQDDYGPYRAIIVGRSTGKMYFHSERSSPQNEGGGSNLYRFDPEKPAEPKKIEAKVGLRAASDETPDGLVYTIDHDNLWSFDVKSEKAEYLGHAIVGEQTYTTSIDADPTGRYLYYIAGAHGGSERDGTPVVQFDTKTKTAQGALLLASGVVEGVRLCADRHVRLGRFVRWKQAVCHLERRSRN